MGSPASRLLQLHRPWPRARVDQNQCCVAPVFVAKRRINPLHFLLSLLPTFRQAFARPGIWVFLLIGVAAFLQLFSTYARVYTPEFGLTKLIMMGHEFDDRGLATYRATPKYIGPSDRWGFDGQHYAQLALDPLLRDPQLRIALDNPSIRARRILLPWLAWLGGLGRPFWILNAYAALNLVFWVGFVVLMTVLFRHLGWAGLAGFSAMLMTCGIIESMRGSLTDFPGFVLVTLSMMIGGAGGAGVLALAALTREPNLMGIVGLWDYRPPWLATTRRNLLRGLIAGLPLLVWFAYVASRFQQKEAMDGGNMSWPLRGIMAKLGEFSVHAVNGDIHWRQWYSELYRSEPLHALLTIVATLTQCLFLLTHRDWNNRIWRVGAFFIPFFLCIGFPSWESHFTVTRHALPITLAFNLVLATRAYRSWPVWFLLGNCFVPYGIYQFTIYGQGVQAPPAEYQVVAPQPSGPAVTIRFSDGWSDQEWNRNHSWRWAVTQRANLLITNPTGSALEAGLSFTTRSISSRRLEVRVRGVSVWTAPSVKPKESVLTARFPLPPGDTIVSLETPLPAVPSGRSADDRRLSFMVQDLQISLSAPPPGG
jgi:hypothetical protein